MAPPASLSPRQAEVARLLDRGLTQGEVAVRLGISRRTVEGHAAKLRSKLGVETTRKAVSRARGRDRGPRSGST